MREFETLDDLKQAVGTQLGTSDWLDVDRERIARFVEATGDDRYLALSLIPVLAAEVYRVKQRRMGVNYGLQTVRFPAPVPSGSRVRAVVELLDVTDVDGGVQVVTRSTVEVEGGSEPACVAEGVVRIYR